MENNKYWTKNPDSRNKETTNLDNFNQFVCTKKNLSSTICASNKKVIKDFKSNLKAKGVLRFELDNPTFPLDKDNKTEPVLVTKVKNILFRDNFNNKQQNDVSLSKLELNKVDSKNRKWKKEK